MQLSYEINSSFELQKSVFVCLGRYNYVMIGFILDYFSLSKAQHNVKHSLGNVV